jgi:hypothetical protein
MPNESERGKVPARRKKPTMKLLTNPVWSGIALLAALSLTASHAQAQQGTFHLPVEAHWGNIVLPPGLYHFSVPMRASWPEILEISSHGKTISILPELEASQQPSAHSYLSLVNIKGTYVIREFHAGALEKVFTFPLPKTVGNEAAGLHKTQTTKLPLGS